MRTKDGDFEPFHLQVLDIRRTARSRTSARSSSRRCSRRSGCPPGCPPTTGPATRSRRRRGRARRPRSPRARVVHGLRGDRDRRSTAPSSCWTAPSPTRGSCSPTSVPTTCDRPTPCAGWTLGHLLAHMEDALDAFTEAAAGRVEVEPVPPTATRVEALREKACALLGAWMAARPASEQVEVGDLGLDAPLLVATAALEITVHGWDVGQATGPPGPDPRRPRRGPAGRRPAGDRPGRPRTPVREPPAGPARGGVRRTPALLDRACAGSHD